MWVHNLNPVLLHFGPLEIRWYGLVYVLGFCLAVWWLKYARQKGFIVISEEQVWDLIFYLMLGVLIGSRVFMIFWNPEIYLFKPWNLLFIWQGGMSFHGGFVGIIVACWWYCQKHSLSFGKVADVISVPAIFALALGRIANFINGELVGKVWDGSWCVVFPEYDAQCRHPNMIYSFLERMVVFGWLLFLSWWTEFKPGFLFWNFVFWEGVGRIAMDFFREYPTENIYLGFSLGQWFSVIMVLVAAYVFWKYYPEDWKSLFRKSR